MIENMGLMIESDTLGGCGCDDEWMRRYSASDPLGFR